MKTSAATKMSEKEVLDGIEKNERMIADLLKTVKEYKENVHSMADGQPEKMRLEYEICEIEDNIRSLLLNTNAKKNILKTFS